MTQQDRNQESAWHGPYAETLWGGSEPAVLAILRL